jgi:hypothetical protein
MYIPGPKYVITIYPVPIAQKGSLRVQYKQLDIMTVNTIHGIS